MKNKKKWIIFFAIVGILVNGVIVLKNFINEKNNTPEIIKQEQTLSMMLEQTVSAGDYEIVTRSTWPTLSDGYKFNESLSICENGSTLSWDSTNGIVTMTGNVSDKCYVYFDLLGFYFSSSSVLKYGSLYLDDISISDKIGNTIEFKAGDILKYTGTSVEGGDYIYIYDANDNLIEELSENSTDYAMTGKEVSIVSKSIKSRSGSLSGGGVAYIDGTLVNY